MAPRIFLPFTSVVIYLVLATLSWSQTYVLMPRNPAEIRSGSVTLPDIGDYTEAVIQQKIEQARTLQPGRVRQLHAKGLVEMRQLYSGDGMFEMGLRQNNVPQVLLIEKGVVELQEVSQAFPNHLVEVGPNQYLARLPLVVGIGGTLVMENCELRLSEESGAFLVNGGTLFLYGGGVLGWREQQNGPATFSGDKYQFRPFFVGWGGSYTYFCQTKAAYLGYFNAKAYGITLASYEVKEHEKPFQRPGIDFYQPARGWFLNSHFSEIYYGFYCYEAEDVVILGNTYHDNIVYAIDPHDRSAGLIIANNSVSDTRQKHGIIISREVTDSYIFNNRSYRNGRSGIMLDRQSTGNQVVGNRVYENGSDGITIYESGNNLIARNTVYDNEAHGVRLRNSEQVVLLDNIIARNQAYGVYLHTRDLLLDGFRDVDKDPYTQAVSGVLSGGAVILNGSGSVFAENSEYFSLYDVAFEHNGGSDKSLALGGDLREFQQEIIRALWGARLAAHLEKSGAY